MRHHDVGQTERRPGRDHGVAAVGDVGERAAVHERGRADQRLHEVRAQRVLEQRGRRALRVDIPGGHGLIVVCAGDDDAGDARLEISDGGREAQRRHDLAGGGDVKPVLARRAVGLAAEAVDDAAELAVVHIHAALPRHAARVDSAGVALLDAVVHHGGNQVVRRGDGVHVAGEMQVDILHRNDLRIAAAGRAALHAEHRAEGRLAQREAGVIALQPQRVGQTDGNGGLALSGGRRVDGGDEHQLALLREILQRDVIDLRLVAAVRFEHFLRDVELAGNFSDGLHLAGLGDFNIGQHRHPP